MPMAQLAVAHTPMTQLGAARMLGAQLGTAHTPTAQLSAAHTSAARMPTGTRAHRAASKPALAHSNEQKDQNLRNRLCGGIRSSIIGERAEAKPGG